jgi:hypothetical protein
MSEPLHHPETGDYLGDIHTAEDGIMVLVDPAGQVRAASTADGQVVDHTPYEVETGSDQQAAELQAQIDWLENQMAQEQQQQQPYHQQMNVPTAEERHQADAEAQQAFENDITMQLEYAEQHLGRALTHREIRQVSEQARNDLDAGRGMDLPRAVERLTETGHIGDTSTVQGKIDYATELVNETRNEAAGRERDDHRTRTAEFYDTTTIDGKTNATLDRLSGYDDVDERTYNGDEL